MNQAPPPEHEVDIRPSKGWQWPDFKEIWRAREIAWALALRDVRVRYKQTMLGVTWAILSPFVTMVIFSVVFGTLIGVDTNGVPYPIFVFSGLLVWRLFDASVHGCVNSLISNQSLFTKLYFPRLLLPLTPLLTALVDFGLSLIVLAGMMVWFDAPIGWRLLTLPCWAGLAMAAGLAIGLWGASLNAMYRDVQLVISYGLSMALFITPVLYTQQTIEGRIPDALLFVYELNPMVAVIDGARWCFVPNWPFPSPAAWAGIGLTFVVLATGLVFFTRTEQNMVDRI